MDTNTEQVTLAELLQIAMDSRLTDLHVALPARIESYDKAKQTVDVQPMLKRALPDGRDNYTAESLPTIADVPVLFPRSGGFFISMPLAKGDFVLLVFAERSMANWRSTGNESDPGDLGMHTLDGAVAIPGIFPDSKALSSADDTNMVLGSDSNGSGRIEIKSNAINLGAGATEGVMTKKDGQALYFAINGAGVTPNDGGASFKAALLVGLTSAGWSTGTTDGQLASAKIKAVR